MSSAAPGVSLDAAASLPFHSGKIGQIAVVVHNLDRALERYSTSLGIGPWSIYTYGSSVMRDMTYMGAPADFCMRIALAQAGGVVVELIQHLSGPTIYRDFLDQHGEGLHHVGVFVLKLHPAIDAAEAQGYRVLQSGYGYGKQGDGGFAYLSTQSELGVVVELIEVPVERIAPERVYPELGPKPAG